VALSFFTCILASLNSAARVLYALAHRGLFHASAQNTHEKHASPHIALVVVTGLALLLALALLLSGWDILTAYGILGSIATYGFLLSYGLVTIAAPVYLYRRKELKPLHVVSAVVAVVLLAVVIFGTVYPVPSWPYNVLPYVFLALVGLGVAYFLFLRWRSPEQLAQVEAEVLGEA
jgi:amino acid transporter